ncbi:Hint domain-containing protein [Thalassococcus sp. S3]|uniref:Hint domain-containing protein n=1 Tax=Thalassococcus sp. S3 TaxID=2017482 RepID=UPI001023F940|nr:Hint domain-containing protein [Thalassococcus sp. S3]QBF33727.1 hypothetical protein CFI11_21305 [Thalassococcus sp. S3]
MPSYSFDGYPSSAFEIDGGGSTFPKDGSAIGKTFRVDPDFDADTDRLQYDIQDGGTGAKFSGDDGASEVGEDTDQYGTVRDAQGNLVGGGPSEQIYLEHGYSVQAPDGSIINFYSVEIGGQPMGFVADGPLQPGVTYTIVSQDNVTPQNQPYYSDFGSVDYDPDAANDIEGGSEGDDIHAGHDDDTVDASSGDDSVDGGTGDDSISGGSGNDEIEGGEGNDTIDGGAQDDTIYGGSGQDQIRGGTGNDRLYGEDGDDTLEGEEGCDTLSGGSGQDSMSGGDDGDVIYGGSGDDTMDGGSGRDWIDGGDDNDSIDGGADHDTIYGGSGDDSMSGGDGNDRIYGDSGNDTIDAGAGDDRIYTGSGNDSAAGGEGTDRIIIGSSGNYDLRGGEDADDQDLDEIDFYTADDGTDGDGFTVTFTGEESGTFSNNDGNITGSFQEMEKIEGSNDSDYIDASASSSGKFLDGDGGDDTIIGSSGDDTIIGERGDDLITTGDGRDTVIFRSGDGDDTITDFSLGDLNGNDPNVDQLDLSDLRGGSGPGGTIRWGDITITEEPDGSARLSFPQGESIVLQGVSPDDLRGNQSGIPCFTAGTLIDTPSGPRPVEELRAGDLVVTRDNGAQPILWSGTRSLTAPDLVRNPRLVPVRIAPGTIGNDETIVVSPQHALLVGALCDQPEALVRAIHLARIRGGRIRIASGTRRVTYVHLLFESHQIVRTHGIWSESFYPGPWALRAAGWDARSEIRALFPNLLAQDAETAYGPTCRQVLRFKELPGHLSDLRHAC